ncbi:MAG: tRNA uridine-5-carboxymethylaminomethyl(34) synthesis GTPase MnmE, partial [Rhodospirillales bacterium]
MTADDTIFAPATGAARAGLAVVRISGPRSRPALVALARRDTFVPRRATRVRLRDAGGEALDDALALWFPAPASFTGEDVAELHLHGGRAVTGAVLAALGGMAGLRPAEAGEFSRRAFRNGKLDLTQVEGLADLIAAETAAQHRQALRQLDGELGRLYEDWRQRLIGVMAGLEAAIDFSDEDLPAEVEADSRAAMAALREDMARHLADGGRGERIRDGLSVVLMGPPNAGKSSLLNQIAGREAAIVDAEPGTTRDIIDVALEVAGLPVVLADTAGLRESAGRIEQEGVRRARRRVADADLRVAVFDGAVWPALDDETMSRLDNETLIVVNKADLGMLAAPVSIAGRPAMAVSALTGSGVAALTTAIGERLRRRFGGGDVVSATRVRHRQGVEECLGALSRAMAAAAAEVAAEEVRAAAAA